MLNYAIKRNVSAPARDLQQAALPLRNLSFAKIEGGKLKGDALLLEGKKIQQVAPTVYSTAKRMAVKVSLRSSKDGVLVFRVKQ